MTEVTIAVAAGCLVQIAETAFSPSAVGWAEATHLEVVADPACGWLDLSLPPGAVLGDHVARQRLGDGTHGRLGEERWERSPRSVDGGGVVRLHVPELLSGDRVLIDVERLLPPGPVTWRPGSARYVAAEVDGDATLANPTGTVTDGRTWMSGAPADFQVTFDGPVPTTALPVRRAPGDVHVERHLTLNVPDGDPQLKLYPGGGSTVVREDFLAFPTSDVERAWPLDAPGDVDIALSAEPSGTATLERDAGGVRLVLLPSEAPTRATVRWEQPDAPTYGERPSDVDRLTVDAPGGEVRWDGDGWSLVGVNGRPVLPTRETLIQALDRRFKMVAIPEPGTPLELRGRDASWELAAILRPTLLDRVAIGDWPADPLWPRKLVRARKSSALTPTEAALTLWLYARQLQLDADWVLVRPASAGPGHDVVPAGYDAALVRITLDGETRWIDPTCAVCAPFELPPDLEGASALGVGISDTPPPTVGRQEVDVGVDTVTWRLDGPPALELRRWLGTLPTAERTSSLATHVGGTGAKLVEVQGIEVAGGSISVVTSRGDGLLPTPFSTPPGDPSGTVWFGWLGDRVVHWQDHDDAILPTPSAQVPDAALQSGPLGWTRVRTPDGLTETLSVTERRVPSSDVERIEAARRGEEQSLTAE